MSQDLPQRILIGMRVGRKPQRSPGEIVGAAGSVVIEGAAPKARAKLGMLERY